jgi:hypothetical protein
MRSPPLARVSRKARRPPRLGARLTQGAAEHGATTHELGCAGHTAALAAIMTFAVR